MDDSIIPLIDEREGLEKLKIVLQIESKNGLELKFKKCQFLNREVEFLGHVVENSTIRPSLTKTLDVKKFNISTNIKHVQSFLSLSDYFGKCVFYYGKIAKSLSDLYRTVASLLLYTNSMKHLKT